MINANNVKKLINNHAKEGCDFLFGVNFELSEGFFIKNPLEQKEILWRVGTQSNFKPSYISSGGSRFAPSPISFDSYSNRFETVRDGLLHGNSFLTNFTIKTPLDTDYTLSEILYRCNSPYALLIPDRLVCFSPETFVRIEGNTISSNPMKGTISSDIPNAEQEILNDYKETAEHYTVVDLIRNDLSRVSTKVNVRRLRYLYHLETSKGGILQVSSEITGCLPDDFKDRLGDIIFELLPAGSVSGAPKPTTLNIIRNAEQEPRGFYCGVFGYFDGVNLDTAVMIRFIEQQNGQLYFRSGSGITVHSLPDYEYKEAIQKIYLPF